MHATSRSTVRGWVTLLVAGALALPALAGGCGTDDNPSTFDGGASSGQGGDGGASSGLFPPSNDGPVACQGLECARVQCAGGVKTTLRGRVFEPAGKIGLYNVIAYIPNAPLPAITHGASCDKCGSLAVSPVASALSDENGDFVLDDVPVGEKIPLVLQVGKWRRVLEVPVQACVENNFNKKDADGREERVRLPASQDEGELPQIAISTGSADPLPCLLPRIGIAAKEFTAPTGTGRVHVYRGNGGNISGVTNNEADLHLWNEEASLNKYDMVMLSCEGGERNQTKSAQQKEYLRNYLNNGGRVFATHYHYTWFKNGPADVAGVATWGTTAGAGGGPNPFNLDVSFPKGQSFSKWLKNNNASPDGVTLSLRDIATSITQHDAMKSTQWVYDNAGTYKTKYMSFNMPIGIKPEDQCGKGVLSDIHVSAGTTDSNIPVSCGTSDLSEQEKALLFLLMDLSSCVQDDKVKPTPPR